MGLLRYCSVALLQNLLAAHNVDTLLHLAEALARKVVDGTGLDIGRNTGNANLIDIHVCHADGLDASLTCSLVRQDNLLQLALPCSSIRFDDSSVAILVLPLSVIVLACSSQYNISDQVIVRHRQLDVAGVCERLFLAFALVLAAIELDVSPVLA